MLPFSSNNINNMEAHQERVVAEKAELDEKHTKLVDFFQSDTFKSLPVDEQARLSRQSKVMGEYSNILSERIAAF